MGREENERSPIIWGTSYDQLKGKRRVRLLLLNFFYLMMVGALGVLVIQSQKANDPFILQKDLFEEYKMKESIYSVLRHKRISLNQALDVAEVTIKQSKTLNIPISLILAVMKKESMFNPYAVSSRKAMGLMQVHPITWREYASKLNLDLSTQAVFDPTTNVIVGTQIIKDLYGFYGKAAYSESETWTLASAAYYAGKGSLFRKGVTYRHLRYVADVKEFKDEFDEKFKN